MWDTIRLGVDRLPDKTSLHLGIVMNAGKWRHASSNRRYPELLTAAQFFAENHLHLRNVVAIRLGKGLKYLPSIQGYTGTVILAWSPQRAYVRILEPELHGDAIVPRIQLHREWDDWPRV